MSEKKVFIADLYMLDIVLREYNHKNHVQDVLSKNQRVVKPTKIKFATTPDKLETTN